MPLSLAYYTTIVHMYAGNVDSEGSLWLVGRLKDVIRTGSENVYASEVESVLESHPCILRAAVVGIPHQRLGEQVSFLQHFDN